LLTCLAAALLLTGCARHYDMTLTSGMRVSYVTKPVLDRASGVYTYKDAAGRRRQIDSAHVVRIDPHSNRNLSKAYGQ
jgi:uncharacterized lipoprotein YajG